MFAVWRCFRRKAQPAPEQATDPADELRARLEESRAREQPSPPHPAAETPAAAPDERRRSLHADARARLDELKGPAKEEG